MQGILLDRQVSIWRKVLSGSGNSASYKDTQVVPLVRAAIVPVSALDARVAFAYESTHIVWVPYWLVLRKEDEVHDGRRLSEPQWTGPQPRIFTIQGRREFRLGIPQIAYYARELD